jgi:hypothetical protein
MSGRYVSLLIKFAVGASAPTAFLIALGLCWGERFVRKFQKQEQITVRPEPRFRFRPTRGLNGCSGAECAANGTRAA